MKRTIVSAISILGFAGALIVSNVQAGEGCTNASLQGTYGYAFTGTNVVAEIIGAAVGIVTFDGAGNLSGRDTFNQGGEIRHRTFTGTYTVNPDCTGSYVVTIEGGGVGTSDFVILAEGSEILSVQTDPPRWVVTIVTKKQ